MLIQGGRKFDVFTQIIDIYIKLIWQVLIISILDYFPILAVLSSMNPFDHYFWKWALIPVGTLGVDLGCINSGLVNKIVSLSEASALEGGLKVSPVL